MQPIDPTKVPEHPIERAFWILSQLRIRRHTLRSLALAKGTHQQALSYALKAPNLPAETIIADALGTKPTVLFKDRYSEDGERLYRHRKATRAKAPRNAKVQARA